VQISINYEELQLLNHPTRLRVFQALEYTATTDADVARRAEVCLHLAICCIIAFGTDRNPTEALRWLVESATLGHVPSQAIVKRMHDALGVRVPEKLQLDLLNWLKAGVESGSWVATEDLKQACEAGEFLTEVYLNARTRFQTVHCGVGYPLFEDDITENYTFVDDACFQEQLKLEMESNHDDSGRARLRSLNSRGDTLLHWAAITGNICVLETILLVDASQVDVTNDFGETPLLSACRAGQFQGTLCLLGHGADASIPTTSGETALHWIVSFTSASECMEVARKLERAGANVKAVAQANRTCVRHFANGLISGTPLHRATARNHIASVRALLTLDKPADPFSEGGPSAVAIGLARPTPIVWASAAHHEAILRLFLEKTGSRQLTCGHGMFSWGNLGTTLLSTAMVVLGGANPFDTPIMRKQDDLGEFTLLFHAVYADNVFQRMVCNGWGFEQAMKNTINLLIERGADPYRVDSFGSTALFSAVERGDCATVRHVLSNTTARRALEKTARGKDYMKPIHVAILWGRRDVFDCLLSANANIGATWGSASSLPLHLCGCAMIPDLQIAETIIKRAPEQVHALDKVETPFATAVRHMNFDIADLLLNYGAEKDVFIGEHRMMTLLGMLLAKGSNDPTAVKYLLEPRPERMEPFFPAGFIVCPPLGLSALHLPVAMRAEKELPPEIAYAMQGGSIGPVMAEVLKVFSAPEQLNAQDFRGLTALHHAVLAQDVDAVANILEYVHSGLDVSPLGPLDVTPLDLAEDAKLQASDLEVKPRVKEKAQRQAAKIVELLREAGALHRRDLIQPQV
jgi:ankyrin repeat protein